MEDRISELPEHILEHVISLLPQDDAIRTCILSKSWRHLGPTRPKIEFCVSDFRGSKEKFIFAFQNTLERYVDQKLSIQEFVLGLFMTWREYGFNKTVFPLLDEWIPIVLMKMGVKKFKLTARDFPLPSLVLEAQFLTELYLRGCKFDQINNKIHIINVNLHMLKCLELHRLCIEPETFEKIMSGCPLIEHLVLDECFGLRAIKVNKAPNLKHLDCSANCSASWYMGIASFGNNDDATSLDSIEINDDAPSLETICIKVRDSDQTWYHHNNDYFFPRLKSLYLYGVNLPTELLNNLSSDNCPSLEELELHRCTGFTEFKLSNRSIKRLIIQTFHHPIEPACFDVASILYFEFKTVYVPSVFSFATTSREWKSHIQLWCFSDSTWYLKLYNFLKALSQSQISLEIFYVREWPDPDSTFDGGISEPVVIEHLLFKAQSSAYLAKLNSLFRICRPRYIQPSFADSQIICESQLAESVLKTLTRQRNLEKYFNIRVKLLLVFFSFCFLFYAARSFFRRD